MKFFKTVAFRGRRQPYHPCKVRVRYATRQEAQAQNCEAYQCRDCGQWHRAYREHGARR